MWESNTYLVNKQSIKFLSWRASVFAGKTLVLEGHSVHKYLRFLFNHQSIKALGTRRVNSLADQRLNLTTLKTTRRLQPSWTGV